MSPTTLLSLLKLALWNLLKRSHSIFHVTMSSQFVCILEYMDLFFSSMAACTGIAASLVISINDYPPGEYNLTIEAVDIFEQSVSEVISIFLPGKSS